MSNPAISVPVEFPKASMIAAVLALVVAGTIALAISSISTAQSIPTPGKTFVTSTVQPTPISTFTATKKPRP